MASQQLSCLPTVAAACSLDKAMCCSMAMQQQLPAFCFTTRYDSSVEAFAKQPRTRCQPQTKGVSIVPPLQGS